MKLHIPVRIAKYETEEWSCVNYKSYESRIRNKWFF